jgi:hypothetical protein
MDPAWKTHVMRNSSQEGDGVLEKTVGTEMTNSMTGEAKDADLARVNGVDQQ